MSKFSINLIVQEGAEGTLLLRIKSQINRAVVILTVIFLIVSIVIFSAFFYFSKQEKNNAAKISSFKAEINRLNKIESFMVSIKDRTKNISLILKERKKYSQIFAMLSELNVPGFWLTDLGIDSSGDIKMEGKCDDIQALTNFNQRLEEIKLKKMFTSIIYPQVLRQKDGRYNLGLSFKQ